MKCLVQGRTGDVIGGCTVSRELSAAVTDDRGFLPCVNDCRVCGAGRLDCCRVHICCYSFGTSFSCSVNGCESTLTPKLATLL
jgi:hypothetical protein